MAEDKEIIVVGGPNGSGKTTLAMQLMADIRRRFPRSIRNFWHIYRQIADEWLLVYNDLECSFLDVAIGRASEKNVLDEFKFREFLDILGDGDGAV